MATLFIANATQQHREIQYRLPERRNAHILRVAPGEQARVRDVTTAEIDAILSQMAKYGWVEASAVDRAKPFVGICYCVDKPVPAGRIVAAMKHNIEVLAKRGKDNRQLAAVAMNNELERQVEAARVGELKELEMTIVEEENRNEPDRERLAEGIVVDRSEPNPEGRKGSSRRRTA
jgi:hypothetical protein